MSGNYSQNQANFFQKKFNQQTGLRPPFPNQIVQMSGTNLMPSNTNYPPQNPQTFSNEILLFSQPPSQAVYPNGSQAQTLLGTPLIPFINNNEKQISATEKNLQIIDEVKKEKEKLEINSKNLNEIYVKGKSKCDLHPKQLSDKCRKCKEIRNEIVKKIKEKESEDSSKIIHQKNIEVKKTEKHNLLIDSDDPNSEIYSHNDYYKFRQNIQQNIPQYIQQNIQQNTAQNQNNFSDPIFKIYGDHFSCNLSSLIANNILCCQYFKAEIAQKGFNEILQEIVDNVTYAEPWAVGMPGIPSTLFCCLYRLMLSKLTEGQVKFLMDNVMSPFLRCTGFLYVRYLANPKDLWNYLSPYLSDEFMFTPAVDKRQVVKMGDYVKNLLKELDYYGTRFPRIPLQIERDIKKKIIEIKEGNNREERVGDYYDRTSERKSHKYPRKDTSSSSSSSDSHSHHRNKRRHSQSRSRSRDRYKERNKEKDINQKVKEKEKESALAKGKEYAVKPTSYKSSLSLKLPGNTKKRSKSPSPLSRNVKYIKTHEPPVPEGKKKKQVEYSKGYLERQEHLRKQYGYVSAQKKNLTENRSSTRKQGSDDTGPDVMRLG